MNLKPFLSWCASHGISSCLDVKVADGGYRYTVLKPGGIDLVQEQINLVQCPLKVCLIGSDASQLANHLAYEVALGSKSKFAPYLATLPDRSAFAETLPRFWSAERLESVADGGFLRRTVQADQPRVASVQDPWALACVDSRANHLPDNSFALTPLLDMINHSGNAKTSATVQNGILSLNVARSSLPTTEPTLFEGLFRRPQSREVRISYGELTNLQTLVNYGFVEQGNPHNIELMHVLMLRRQPVTVKISKDGSIDPLAVSTIRLYVPTTADDEFLTGNRPSPASPPFLSNRNEIEVHALLLGFLEDSITDARYKLPEQDPLIVPYLEERAKTLQMAANKIKDRFPALVG
jgi:hypothetical protein